MKTIINKIFILLSILFAVAGCKSDDMEYSDLEVTPVEDLYAPVKDHYVVLKATKDATLLFQWAPSYAEDGQMVSYEVIFYETADSSKPIYRIASDNVGKENYASISHLDINRICSAAGIPVGETGTIYWSVTSWRGINSATCPNRNSLVATRLDGFEIIPENVYITGSATEKGENMAEALMMKKIDDGEFEIYTELDNVGEFYFVDRKTDNPAKSYINAAGSLKEANEGETSTINTKAVYRIKINYLTRGTEITKIKEMQLWHCWEQAVLLSSAYNGSGNWIGTTNDFKKINGNGDNRYKIRMIVEDKNGATFNWWWGPTNKDEDGDPTGNAAYYYLALYENPINQWDPKWKMFGDNQPQPWGKTVTFTVSLGVDKPYTHSVEF